MTTIPHDINEVPDASRLLVNKFGATLPSSGVALADAIVVTGSEHTAGYLNVFFTSDVAAALSVKRTVGAVTTPAEKLNMGSAIGAGTSFAETIVVAASETIELVFGGTGGTYSLKVATVIQR